METHPQVIVIVVVIVIVIVQKLNWQPGLASVPPTILSSVPAAGETLGRRIEKKSRGERNISVDKFSIYQLLTLPITSVSVDELGFISTR